MHETQVPIGNSGCTKTGTSIATEGMIRRAWQLEPSAGVVL